MLRATARVHIPCDGRPLGRILVTRWPRSSRWTTSSTRTSPRPGRRMRSDSRVIRAVRRIGARLPGTARAALRPAPASRSRPRARRPRRRRRRFDNGFGAARPEGDYELLVAGDRVPPAPWANVIANAHGGFLVTERGGGFTWAENSYFFRLTPWHNDPVADPVSEVLYLRDDESDDALVRHAGDRVRRGRALHGAARRRRARRSSTSAAASRPRSPSGWRTTPRSSCRCSASPTTATRPRRIAVTAYVEWTLGVHARAHPAPGAAPRFDRVRARDPGAGTPSTRSSRAGWRSAP